MHANLWQLPNGEIRYSAIEQQQGSVDHPHPRGGKDGEWLKPGDSCKLEWVWLGIVELPAPRASRHKMLSGLK